MNLKKNALSLSLALVLLGCSIFFLFYRKYDISEVTPENYNTILKVNTKKSLQAVWSTEIFGNREFFVEPKQIRENQYWAVSEEKVQGGKLYRIMNRSDFTVYTFNFLDDNPNIMYRAAIQNAKPDETGLPSYSIARGKEIIQKLLTEEAFTLKRTSLKEGPDIVIKDLGDLFLIGKVDWGPRDPEELFIISFELYDKTKALF